MAAKMAHSTDVGGTFENIPFLSQGNAKPNLYYYFIDVTVGHIVSRQTWSQFLMLGLSLLSSVEYVQVECIDMTIHILTVNLA